MRLKKAVLSLGPSDFNVHYILFVKHQDNILSHSLNALQDRKLAHGLQSLSHRNHFYQNLSHPVLHAGKSTALNS